MKSKWPDFLLTIAIRSAFGLVAGLLVGVPIIFLGDNASPLVELIQAGQYQLAVLWFVLWGVGGAIVGVYTTPRWQRPWYKYKRWNDPENEDIHVI